ncbi:hypothetical protein [Nocardia sp. NPDC058497]|uniref:hypothetical protein n=1 Tax=Nocardia sp. NPDC058497 TaxID=3346529 RepID=UPI003654564F
MRTKPWPALTLLISAPILMNLAFTGLGVSFDYPDVLQLPATEALAKFRAEQTTVVLVPLGVESAGLTNFLGYLLWSAWLLAFATLLARHGAMPSRVASQGS